MLPYSAQRAHVFHETKLYRAARPSIVVKCTVVLIFCYKFMCNNHITYKSKLYISKRIN